MFPYDSEEHNLSKYVSKYSEEDEWMGVRLAENEQEEREKQERSLKWVLQTLQPF
jgi:hypothetical protein